MKKAILILASSCFLFSCAKNSGQSVQVIKVTDARFAVDAVPRLGMSYTAYACTTADSMPGTKCIDTKGSSCKSESNCQAVPADIRSGLYTQQEIDEKIILVEKAYGIKYTY